MRLLEYKTVTPKQHKFVLCDVDGVCYESKNYRQKDSAVKAFNATIRNAEKSKITPDNILKVSARNGSVVFQAEFETRTQAEIFSGRLKSLAEIQKSKVQRNAL